MTTAMPFDLEALTAAAGDKRARRALGYAHETFIDVIDVEDGRVVAHVRGETDTYLVEMGDPAGADARCSCPDAGELSAVCKHMLAVAMLVNERGGAAPTHRLARLREALDFESKEDLIERIVGLAKARPQILAALEEG